MVLVGDDASMIIDRRDNSSDRVIPLLLPENHASSRVGENRFEDNSTDKVVLVPILHVISYKCWDENVKLVHQ